jgi:hypothetical protein
LLGCSSERLEAESQATEHGNSRYSQTCKTRSNFPAFTRWSILCLRFTHTSHATCKKNSLFRLKRKVNSKNFFEGFWVLSNKNLESVPHFKAIFAGKITREISLDFHTEIDLTINQLCFLKQFNETLFTKILNKHENPVGSGCLYFLPRFQNPRDFLVEEILNNVEQLLVQKNALETILSLPIEPLASIRSNLDEKSISKKNFQVEFLIF